VPELTIVMILLINSDAPWLRI